MGVQIMVYGYLAVCLAMIVFNCVTIVIHRRETIQTRRVDKVFKKLIRNQVLEVEQGNAVTERHRWLLAKRCKIIWYLAAVDEVLTSLQEEHAKAVQEYVDQISPLLVKLSEDMMHRKDPVQKAHLAYFLEKYHIINPNTLKGMLPFLFSMVGSNNLYCRENALKIIYQSGDPKIVKKAMQHIFEYGHFHHEKLLIEGLLLFNGDKESLIAELMQGLDQEPLSMRLTVLNFTRFSSGNHCERYCQYLMDEKENDEIRIVAIRYFGKYYYEPAKEILQDFAKNRDENRWEYAAVAATSLALYQESETIDILKDCLTSANWYIRYNAALSLEKFGLSYAELADVYDGKDRYAQEMLRYRMEMHQYEEEGGEE